MLVENYVDLIGGWDEAFKKHSHYLDHLEFNEALARMLGWDMRHMVSDDVAQRLGSILSKNSANEECRFVWDLMPYVHRSQSDSYKLIRGLRDGFLG